MQEFFHNQRCTRNGFENEQMPALKALGNRPFALARQQRNGTHFAKIRSNRIIRLERSWCKIEFTALNWSFLFRLFGADIDTFRGIASSPGAGGIFVDFDAVALKDGK